jgi:glucose-1-phosphate cytidylyltransferase
MPAVTDRSSTPVVILCGGRGTRLQEHVREIPKPLVEIGGLPIVWHVIQLYAVQGFSRFILATGYQAELVSGFVDARRWPDGVQVRCVDTGPDTPTGGRIQRLAGHLDGERFAATYADGLADVDLRELERHHREHGGLATMTVVRPELQFGVTELQDGGSRVVGFHEKPRLQQWINGGFFFFEAAALDYLGPDSVLEREPLERLANDGELHAYRHAGFWECMDTYKDAIALNDLWSAGAAPWRLWH